ncbi:MAG: DNA-packaging protein [Lachnospiraceae bacterium]|nr:DNA-packaging protein [Lachnospiraceae bacterium]
MAAVEITSDLVKTLRNFLRVKNESADTEIQALAEACLLHLEIAGVYITDLADPLAVQAVKLYCKAHFGYDSDTERFEQAYSSLRDSMALCGDYVKGGGDDG